MDSRKYFDTTPRNKQRENCLEREREREVELCRRYRKVKTIHKEPWGYGVDKRLWSWCNRKRGEGGGRGELKLVLKPICKIAVGLGVKKTLHHTANLKREPNNREGIRRGVGVKGAKTPNPCWVTKLVRGLVFRSNATKHLKNHVGYHSVMNGPFIVREQWNTWYTIHSTLPEIRPEDYKNRPTTKVTSSEMKWMQQRTRIVFNCTKTCQTLAQSRLCCLA